MPELTKAQKLLIRYCKEQNFSRIQTTGVASVQATDQLGQTKALSINLYGDIIDIHARKIIAVGNTAHDVMKTYELPTAWKDVRPSIRKVLEEKGNLSESLKHHTQKILRPEL